MTVFLLYTATILSSVFTGLFYKLGSLRQGKNLSAPALLCAVYMFLTSCYFLAVIFINGETLKFSLSTFLCAALCGICLSLAAYLYLRSLACGPYTTSVVLLNFSSFMTIFYGIIFLDEQMSLIQGIGFVIMLGCIYTLTVSKVTTAEKKKANAKWMVLIILTFATNSLINFGIRMQSVFNNNGEKNQMMFLYFVFASLTSIITFAVTGGFKSLHFSMIKDICEGTEDDEKTAPVYLTAILPAAIGLSLTLGINSISNSFLVQYATSAIQYPVSSGTSLMISAFIGRIFFKEKLKPPAYIAIVVGIAVITLLNIF